LILSLQKEFRERLKKNALEKEGMKLADFKVKSFPELSCSGTRKKIAVKPNELKLLSIEEDELNEGKLKISISFRLEKGNYATTILRELMKTA